MLKTGGYKFVRRSNGINYKLYHIPSPTEFKSLKKSGLFTGTFKDFSMACGYYDMVEPDEESAEHVEVQTDINFEETEKKEDICPF